MNKRIIWSTLALAAFIGLGVVGNSDRKQFEYDHAYDICIHTYNIAHTAPSTAFMDKCIKAEIADGFEDDDR